MDAGVSFSFGLRAFARFGALFFGVTPAPFVRFIAAGASSGSRNATVRASGWADFTGFGFFVPDLSPVFGDLPATSACFISTSHKVMKKTALFASLLMPKLCFFQVLRADPFILARAPADAHSPATLARFLL
jgi:hypothetical protein